MSKSINRHFDNLRKIFIKSVDAVQPISLFSNQIFIEKHDANIFIQSNCVNLKNKKCHLIGFGKAVLGMAVQMERILDKRLVSGILSVPIGTTVKLGKMRNMQLKENSVIKIFEGAEFNLPDSEAMETSIKIMEMAKSMQADDILFVMISGGGSALLPLPKYPIKLEEKLKIIQTLSAKGADINEINIVRISMSITKGGKLAKAAQNAHKVVSLIISDIVGDPLDLIASGPTVPIQNREISPKNILEKYQIWETLSDDIKEVVANNMDVNDNVTLANSSVYIIGNNKVATDASNTEAIGLGYHPFILTTTLNGNVTKIVAMYRTFLEQIVKLKDSEISEEELLSTFPFDCRIFEEFMGTVHSSMQDQKPLCLILAGEPTVNITGSGKGGRNQDIALRMSLEFFKSDRLKDVCFLSAGTDGIDGPTPAAGALGSRIIIENFLKTNTLERANELIQNSDSYNFYNQLENGSFHVITGHTGTNVMDVHLIVIP